MFKGHKKHILFLLASFLVLLIFELMSPKKIDWSLSFERSDKIPFGTYVLYDLLPNIFSKNEITLNEKSLYERFNKSESQDNIIIITKTFSPNKMDLNELLDIVYKGSNAFISANEIYGKFADTLKLSLDFFFRKSIIEADTNILNYTNSKIKTDSGYIYYKALNSYYISKFDTTNSLVLGFSKDSLVNFIKISHGRGHFFINTNPLAFTNYNLLLRNNYEYVSKSLSFLPNRNTIWDEYYKPNKKISRTPLRYILSNKALKYAYYLLIVGIFIYIIFESKRKQKIIPVINAPKNTSLEFINTISRLYYSKGNHRDIAIKKFKYFIDFLNSKYFISDYNKEDINKIAEKTGVNSVLINDIFTRYNNIVECKNISSDQLIKFNDKIEKFYSQTK